MATGADIIVRMGFDGKGFRAGVQIAERSIESFATRTAKRLAGIFTVSYLGHKLSQYVRETMKWADEMVHVSERLGLTIEETQQLQWAAEKTGASFEGLGRAMKAASEFRLEALSDPQGKSGRLAEALGLSHKELKGMSGSMELFVRLASIIENNDFGAAQLAIASDLFGKNAVQFIPMMKDGLAGVVNEAKNLGLVVEDSVLKSLHEVNIELEKAQFRLRAIATPWFAKAFENVANIAEYVIAQPKRLKNVVLGMTSFPAAAIVGAAEGKKMGEWQFGKSITANLAQGIGAVLKNLTGGTVNAANMEAIYKAIAPETKLKTIKTAEFKPMSDELARIGGFTGRGTFARAEIAAEKTADNTSELLRQAKIITATVTDTW